MELVLDIPDDRVDSVLEFIVDTGALSGLEHHSRARALLEVKVSEAIEGARNGEKEDMAKLKEVVMGAAGREVKAAWDYFYSAVNEAMAKYEKRLAKVELTEEVGIDRLSLEGRMQIKDPFTQLVDEKMSVDKISIGCIELASLANDIRLLRSRYQSDQLGLVSELIDSTLSANDQKTLMKIACSF